jgi:O-antigen ligase
MTVPRSLVDAALLLAGLVATLLVTVGFVRDPQVTAALLAAALLVAAVVVERRRLARLRFSRVIVALLLLIPLTALIGPSLALPSHPQFFAFRVFTALAAFFVFVWLVLTRGNLRFGARRFATLFALWFGWLLVAMLWAPDKGAGFRYLVIMILMLALVGATAAAGATNRRLRALCAMLALAYALIVGMAVIEFTLGIRLPVSRLLYGNINEQYQVTSVFHNQNDLATYLAICWPFFFTVFFVTRRMWWWLASLAAMAFCALDLVRTGSRSSVLAIGLETVVAVLFFARLGARLTSRRNKIIGVLLALALVGAAGYLSFNNSQSTMLRQFRLQELATNVQQGQGSGDIRTQLLHNGLYQAGHYLLLGGGPGQAQTLMRTSPTPTGIVDPHNWWLEVLVNGGLPATILHGLLYFGLMVALFGIARRNADRLLRYLAASVMLALVGFLIGALGPSSSISFAPLWVLWGVGMAVVSRAALAARDAELQSAP